VGAAAEDLDLGQRQGNGVVAGEMAPERQAGGSRRGMQHGERDRHKSVAAELRLFEAVERMELHASGEKAEAVEADVFFHRRMFEAAHNAMLLGLMRPVFALLRANFESAIERDAGQHYYVEEHRRVADAVQRRDPAGAREAMRQLLQNNARHIDETRAVRKSRLTAA
jgi:DNA-binding FadR family transcriptional regulator